MLTIGGKKWRLVQAAVAAENVSGAILGVQERTATAPNVKCVRAPVVAMNQHLVAIGAGEPGK